MPAFDTKRCCERDGTSVSVKLFVGRWDVSVRANFWGRDAPSGDRAALRFDIRAKSTRPKSEGRSLLGEDADCVATNTLGSVAERNLV
jgi:hypothetical protein